MTAKAPADKYQRPPTSRALRRQAWQRDGGRCRRCPAGSEVYAFDAEIWNGDHIVPLVDGGRDELGNIWVLCIPHHAAKTAAEAHERAERARRQLRARLDSIARRSPIILARGFGTCQACRIEYRVGGSAQIYGHKAPGTKNLCPGAFDVAAEVLPTWT